MNKHQIKGATNQVTGEIKEQVGKLTGDRSTELKGHAREVKGKLQSDYGNAKEEVRRERQLDRTADIKRR